MLLLFFLQKYASFTLVPSKIQNQFLIINITLKSSENHKTMIINNCQWMIISRFRNFSNLFQFSPMIFMSIKFISMLITIWILNSSKYYYILSKNSRFMMWYFGRMSSFRMNLFPWYSIFRVFNQFSDSINT